MVRITEVELNNLHLTQVMMKKLTHKFQQAHWLVKGSHFETLHKKFEELYTWSFEKEDVLAEKALMFGELPALENMVGIESEVDNLFSGLEIHEGCLGNNKALLELTARALEKTQTFIHLSMDRSVESRANEKIETLPELSTMYEDMLNEIQRHLWMLRTLSY